MPSRHLHYLSNSTLPSVSANSIQVIKMCDAFARCGRRVHLHGFANKKAPKRSPAEILKHYGVAGDFALTLYRDRKSVV